MKIKVGIGIGNMKVADGLPRLPSKKPTGISNHFINFNRIWGELTFTFEQKNIGELLKKKVLIFMNQKICLFTTKSIFCLYILCE